ncbi:DUF3592 domain-containing protein [Streptomyces sp. NBC_00572]|uniref:DUF3592 domain-containing protein n=1 Tax=Streptomyces sp. NBC_00572 TaxID=2903664 RepID=UPI00224EDA7F|nr:DUF3592 domain-containing protein [Streptomyces sp. NBC_00572]MCX4980802.1 hypothetical protein [Streptomyces sp. NBC_00572]
MTTPLVLRGGSDATLRFEGGAVNLRQADGEHHIPLAAVARVRAGDGVVEIELTALDEDEAVTYRVETASAADATAFAEAVTAALPEHETVSDGSENVVSRLTPVPLPRRIAEWGGAALCALVMLGLLYRDVRRSADRGEYGWALVFAGPVAFVGAALALNAGHALHRRWSYRRDGITATAEFSHHADDRKARRVYRYTDTTGRSHTYTSKSGGGEVRVSYLPHAPHRAVTAATPGRLVGLVALLLVGAAVCVGGIFGVVLSLGD